MAGRSRCGWGWHTGRQHLPLCGSPLGFSGPWAWPMSRPGPFTAASPSPPTFTQGTQEAFATQTRWAAALAPQRWLQQSRVLPGRAVRGVPTLEGQPQLQGTRSCPEHRHAGPHACREGSGTCERVSCVMPSVGNLSGEKSNPRLRGVSGRPRPRLWWRPADNERGTRGGGRVLRPGLRVGRTRVCVCQRSQAPHLKCFHFILCNLCLSRVKPGSVKP